MNTSVASQNLGATQLKPRTPGVVSRLRRIGIALFSLLATLVVLVAAIPVLLLFLITSVPLVISIIVALVDVGILIALSRVERTAAAVSVAVLGMIGVSIVAVWLSQVFATTPPITDAQGNVVPNSIATLESVQLGGSEQWITVRGRDMNSPVLLFLAGGPGGSELVWTRRYLSGLEDHFVVVNWDQPGTGKSYNAVPIASLTPERYLSDAYELIQILRTRFGQDKIYLMGESGGTVWGIQLVQRHPELFHAFVSGGGQMVNTTENDVMGYEFALRLAAERGDTNTVESLRQNGPPPYAGGDMLLTRYFPYMNLLNGYMHAHAAGDGAEGNRMLDVITGTEYGLLDKFNWFRGLLEVFAVVYPQWEDLDFTTQATELEVPVYFMEGRWDVNAMASLVEEYYNLLEAPHKELIWFENSGHDPLYEESGRFIDLMVNTVLAQTQEIPH